MKMNVNRKDLEGAVKVPEGKDKNEWLAFNTVEFYNEIKFLF